MKTRSSDVKVVREYDSKAVLKSLLAGIDSVNPVRPDKGLDGGLTKVVHGLSITLSGTRTIKQIIARMLYEAGCPLGHIQNETETFFRWRVDAGSQFCTEWAYPAENRPSKPYATGTSNKASGPVLINRRPRGRDTSVYLY